MMLLQEYQKRLTATVIVVVILIDISDARAHGDMEWNDFTIDNYNNTVENSISHVQEVIADIILARRPVNEWPDRELLEVRTELAHFQEEIDDLLNHFNEEAIHHQLKRQQLEHPRVGRTVAASHALETAIILIDYMHSLNDQLAFEDELHNGGKGAFMYDLMESYRDKMTLYHELTVKHLAK